MGSIPLILKEEVQDALAMGQPVVALESNVIVHGLPYPDNLIAARKMEQAVRSGGAVPATVWIERGGIMVGAGDGDIERLASAADMPKVNSRDMSAILAVGGIGATTVSASLVAAALAGITFFSSAGIGGVHRGGENSMDISSDLVQFTRSRVAVVCAGAKKILDLERTLEFLETYGVPVIAFQSDDFPAFYCRSSGVRAPHRMDDEPLIARAIQRHWDLGQHTSVLVATPICEADAIPDMEIDAVIDEAMHAAERDGVRGAAITKYLMRAVDRATQGRSVLANISVLVSTAELAGRIATAYAAQRRAGAI